MIEWLPVVGYEEKYEVSNDGRVRTNGKRSDGRQFPAKEISQHLQNGYSYVSLYRGKVGRGIAVHRLMLEAFTGIRRNKMECNHKNGKKNDNRLKNLEWATRSENQIHAIKMGLRPRRTKGAFKKGNRPWNAGVRTGQIPWNKGKCYLKENNLLPSHQ